MEDRWIERKCGVWFCERGHILAIAIGIPRGLEVDMEIGRDMEMELRMAASSSIRPNLHINV